VQWFTHTSGRASQQNLFGDSTFWRTKFLDAYKQHAPFKTLDSFIGNPSANFQRVIGHPMVDAYYRRDGADGASSLQNHSSRFSPSPASMMATS